MFFDELMVKIVGGTNQGSGKNENQSSGEALMGLWPRNSNTDECSESNERQDKGKPLLVHQEALHHGKASYDKRE